MSPREVIFRLTNMMQSAVEYRIRKVWYPETCCDAGPFRPIPFFRYVSKDLLEQLPDSFELQVEAIVKGEAGTIVEPWTGEW